MNTLLRTLLLLLVAGIGYGYRSAKVAASKTFLGIHEHVYIIAALLLGIVLFGRHFIIYRKHKTIQSIGYDTLPILLLVMIAFVWMSLLIVSDGVKQSSALFIAGGAMVMAYALLLLFAAWKHVRSKRSAPGN
ncbi:MAG: hypothetical protein ACTHMC_11080 [Pseudobacter sp.]|uniref:hypothetical protein n=1 Tax=Pseudobacter sp. TaxID=2045420 RepID=UPI003F7D8C9B